MQLTLTDLRIKELLKAQAGIFINNKQIVFQSLIVPICCAIAVQAQDYIFSTHLTVLLYASQYSAHLEIEDCPDSGSITGGGVLTPKKTQKKPKKKKPSQFTNFGVATGFFLGFFGFFGFFWFFWFFLVFFVFFWFFLG